MRSDFNMETVIEHFRFEPFELQVERIRDLDQLVDQVSDEMFNEDERMPYWAELWPSAIALSRYVATHKDRFVSKSIIELGCGIGLTSLCLALCNPSFLLLTDYEPAALEATKNNFIRNGLDLPDVYPLDWRFPEIESRFEIIVASDIVYEERFFLPIISLFDKHLEKNGQIILAEPGRSIAQKFFELLNKRGYFFHINREEVIQNGRKIRVNIFNIKKNPR